jgi:hypothetical protein
MKPSYMIFFGLAAGCALGVGADRMYLDPPQPSPVASISSVPAFVPPQRARTVDWFVANPIVAKQKVDACNNDPGNAGSDAECLNALEARDKIGIRLLLNGR